MIDHNGICDWQIIIGHAETKKKFNAKEITLVHKFIDLLHLYNTITYLILLHKLIDLIV